MKCPECEAAGARSKVFTGPGWETAMWSPPFYDEEGRYHNHDPNFVTHEYKCSEGHSWKASRRHKCPVDGCDFNREHADTGEQS